jgi:hypothetical protein
MARSILPDCEGVVMAAAGSRTLKLSLLADVAEFTKGIKTAGKDTESIGDQFTDFGKKAALAFAAAGAAIGAFAKQAIENAAADEKAQRNLALTIENTTNATAEQIKGVEKYISTTSLAIGITDDELRPAFARLTRSTKDVEEAQKLLNLALDISSATGKPLEAVANALGKAYDGNLTALGRLGLGIDQSVLKSKNFDLVFQSLTSTFGGFAENEADSTEKGFARIKIAVDELNEQIGAALLPIVQELSAFILAEVVPVLQQFVNGLTGDDGVTASLTEAEKKGLEWGKKLRGVINTVVDLKDELIATAAVIGTIFVVSKIAAGVTATIALIKSLIVAYNLLKASAIVAGIASAFALNPLLGVGAVAVAAAVLAAANALTNQADETQKFAVGGAPGFITGGAASGTVSSSVSGSKGVGGGGGTTVTTTTPSGIATAAASAARAGGAFTDSQNAARLAAAGGGGFTDSQNAARINLTVNGALDAEGTARTIVETLNNSFFRGTGGASNLQAI